MGMSLNLHMEDTEERMYLHAQRCTGMMQIWTSLYIMRSFWWGFGFWRMYSGHVFQEKEAWLWRWRPRSEKASCYWRGKWRGLLCFCLFLWSNCSFFICFVIGNQSNKALLLCRSGLMKTWMFCNGDWHTFFYECALLKRTGSLCALVEVKPVLSLLAPDHYFLPFCKYLGNICLLYLCCPIYWK